MQPTPVTCGQACIAMIAGRDIKEVIQDMKTSGPTSIGHKKYYDPESGLIDGEYTYGKITSFLVIFEKV